MDFSGKHPIFDIKAELSKNRRAERFPMPPILKEMMRHRDIKTTEEFYITQNEEQTAAAVWEAACGVQEHTLRHTLPSSVDVSPCQVKEGTEAERMRVSSRPVQV